MSNPGVAPFYYLEQGPIFSDTFDIDSVNWSNLNAGRTVVPETLAISSGIEPGKLVFQVYADSAAGAQGVFTPVGSAVDATAMRPDGVVGNLSLPAYAGAPLEPFTIVRLRELPAVDSMEAAITRYVAVVLSCTLDLASESWTVTALEIPRWRMSKYTVMGELWHDTTIEGNVAPDPVNPRLFKNVLPVFNADGKRDMYTSVGGVRELEFYHPDFKFSEASGYIVAFWRLGDILNYLRKIYWEINPDTGLTYGGLVGCSSYMDWDEVTAVTHPYLFAVAGVEQVATDLTLGGMTLSEAIDTVVRKAGLGYEWTVTYNADDLKWKLEFFDTAGTADATLTRGTMGGTVGTPPALVSGKVVFDWTDASTSVRVFGKPNIHECTIAYDPDGLFADFGAFPDLLKPDWTTDAQTNYESAEVATDVHADEDFPSVFCKFTFREDKSWADAFGGTFTPTHQGIREILSEMVSEVSNGKGRIKASVYRWDPISATFFPAPEGVHLSFTPEGGVLISGVSQKDPELAGTWEVTPGVFKLKQPRYLCDATGVPPWPVRPFVITLTVLGDERALGEDATDIPAGWPPDLEDCPALSHLDNQWRYNAIHFLDAAGVPVSDDPITIGQASAASPDAVVDNQYRLDVAATRRKKVVGVPGASGELSLGGNFDWGIHPGVRITELTGAGGLPTIYLYAVVKGVVFGGLGSRGTLARMQTIEVGNG